MAWVENGDSSVSFLCEKELPNIFLIGDSIRRGYCATVKEELSGKAGVYYVNENCKHTQNVISSMKRWAGLFDNRELVDIVHFNCGHWDVAHWNGYELSLTSPSEYEKNIRMIIRLLRGFFPRARIIFATTTPMNPDGGSVGGVNPRSTEEIAVYNAIAVKVASEEGVDVSDLNAYMSDWGPDSFVDTCHLTPDAFARLGKEVARRLSAYL